MAKKVIKKKRSKELWIVKDSTSIFGDFIEISRKEMKLNKHGVFTDQGEAVACYNMFAKLTGIRLKENEQIKIKVMEI